MHDTKVSKGGGVVMNQKEVLQKEIDSLGIVNINAQGELSVGLVQNAIDSTKNLLSCLDLNALAKEADEKEKVYLS